MKRTLLFLVCLIGCDLTLGVSLQKETGKSYYYGPDIRAADAIWRTCKPDCTMAFEKGSYMVLDGTPEELFEWVRNKKARRSH